MHTYPRVSSRTAVCQLARPHAARILHRRASLLGAHQQTGDVYLRCLLTHGARAVLLTAQRTHRTHPERATRLQQWAVTLAARRGHNKAAIAVANKLARLVWAVRHHDIAFQAQPDPGVAA
jgi:hypothetical protein